MNPLLLWEEEVPFTVQKNLRIILNKDIKDLSHAFSNYKII